MKMDEGGKWCVISLGLELSDGDAFSLPCVDVVVFLGLGTFLIRGRGEWKMKGKEEEREFEYVEATGARRCSH